MIPYLFIFIAALVGLYIWGFMGLILGAVGGYLLTFVFGLLLLRLNAGVVPREYRESTATSFISLHPDLIQGAFPNANQKAVHKAVEDHLERIFQRAAIDNKSIFLNPQHKVAIHDAATQLISEEQNLQMKAFLVSLEEHIEREMYPYESSCWRREYFSLIKQFLNLEAAGMAVYGQEYDVEKTFPNLLKHRYPDWTEKEIKDFIVRNQERFLSDYYKNQFFDVALAEKPEGDKEFLQTLVDKNFEQQAAVLRVRSLLAEVIERECGSEEREAFFKALFMGEVK